MFVAEKKKFHRCGCLLNQKLNSSAINTPVEKLPKRQIRILIRVRDTAIEIKKCYVLKIKKRNKTELNVLHRGTKTFCFWLTYFICCWALRRDDNLKNRV